MEHPVLQKTNSYVRVCVLLGCRLQQHTADYFEYVYNLEGIFLIRRATYARGLAISFRSDYFVGHVHKRCPSVRLPTEETSPTNQVDSLADKCCVPGYDVDR